MSFAMAIKHEVRIHIKMAASAHPDMWPGHDVLSVQEGWPLLADAEDKRAGLIEAVLLLADADTVEAARKWQNCVWSLRKFHEDPTVTAEDIRSSLQSAADARDAFYVCARPDLGIRSALPPPATLSARPEIAQATITQN